MAKSLVLASVIALISSAAYAQAPAAPAAGAAGLTTRMGHELNLSVQHYDYTEPLGEQIDVKIHGPKFGGEYTGTFALGQRGRWFGQFNVRATGVTASYDGSCRPWQIVPSTTSPNGYRLTLGSASPCSESGDADWYVDGRALAGKDFSGARRAIAPFAGVGVRHLSNGTTGNFNYRTQEYLYVPVGMTIRARTTSGRVLGVTIEYDHLLRGWNTTRGSLLRGGTVPATSTAPAFSIGDFTDTSFKQHKGWALRANASYQLNRSWSLEPYYVRWRVSDSPVSEGSVAYTVNNITARQTLGYYEPLNFTNEFGVKIGWHFAKR
ncbi:MAG: hypothetical protein EPO35_00995 [Acidobacteria bacterium]|nr:MAG: hypothetical protein EPO35_00995 [Acidobacteriota bacterium]